MIKWRTPPEVSGGSLRNYTEDTLRFVKRISQPWHMSTIDTADQSPSGAPQARRRPAQLRQGGRGRARGLRRARRVDVAGGDRAPRQVGIGTLYRHFPTRQALLEAVYVDEVESALPLGGRPLRTAAVGGARRLAAPVRGLHGDQAGAGPGVARLRGSRRQPVSPTAARRCTRPASRCSSALSRRRSCAPTRTIAEVIQMVGGIAKIPVGRPGADRAHPRHRARRPALPATGHLVAAPVPGHGSWGRLSEVVSLPPWGQSDERR